MSGVETQHLNVDAEKPLCKLVVDWLETAMQDQPVDELSENVIHLQCAVTSNHCNRQNSANCLVYCVTCKCSLLMLIMRLQGNVHRVH